MDATSSARSPSATPLVSVIVPVFNEEECIGATVEEIFQVLGGAGLDFELLVVNDGSTDRTAQILATLRAREPRLRVIQLAPNSGQSAAFGAGFQFARGQCVVLMDGDGQNDPRDITRLVAALDDCDVCCGYRAVRRDPLARRLAGRLANAIRSRLLHDDIIDTGCSLKAIRTEMARALPMRLAGMHRFLPALLLMQRARVRQLAVNHRPRRAGRSKYTNFGRLLVTVGDVRAVRWMQKRHRRFQAQELS